MDKQPTNKWTLLVNHHKNEKITKKSKNDWMEHISKIENAIAKDAVNTVPQRLFKVQKFDNAVFEEMFDLKECYRGASDRDSSISTVIGSGKEEDVIPSEESVIEESSYDSGGSVVYTGMSSKKGRKTKTELFELELSEEEEWTPVRSKSPCSTAQSTVGTHDDLIVHPGEENVLDFRATLKTAVINFFKKTPEQVRSEWAAARGRKQVHDAIDRDEEMIHKIATDFCSWAKAEGLQSPVLSEETIMDLFRFKFTDNVVVESMMVNIKQLQNVPAKLVKHNPALSSRAELFRQILWDKIDYDKPQDKKYGFGKANEKRKKKEKPDPVEYWLKPDLVPQDLISTEAFFKPLLDSQILEKFVIWLLEDPTSYKPQCLVDIGYIDFIIEKNGGLDKILEAGKRRRNRQRFFPSEYQEKEESFLKSIRIEPETLGT